MGSVMFQELYTGIISSTDKMVPCVPDYGIRKEMDNDSAVQNQCAAHPRDHDLPDSNYQIFLVWAGAADSVQTN